MPAELHILLVLPRLDRFKGGVYLADEKKPETEEESKEESEEESEDKKE